MSHVFQGFKCFRVCPFYPQGLLYSSPPCPDDPQGRAELVIGDEPVPLPYGKTGLHHAEFYGDKGVVEWGVYKWMMRRASGQETSAKWDRRSLQKMWKEWVVQWGITRKQPRRRRGAGAMHEKVLDRRERDKARPGILLCAPLRLKGPEGKVQSTSGQWYDVHADMFRRDNIPVVEMHKGGEQVPWPVLRMTAWAFPTATMRTTDVRGQW